MVECNERNRRLFAGLLTKQMGRGGIQPVAERYLYLPAVGCALLVTLTLMQLRRRAIIVSLAGLILVAYAILTIERNPAWRDNTTLWQDTVEKMPGSPWAHANRGLRYEQRGDLSHALTEYAWAADLFVHDQHLPGYAVMVYQRAGEAALTQGRLSLAGHHFQEARRLGAR